MEKWTKLLALSSMGLLLAACGNKESKQPENSNANVDMPEGTQLVTELKTTYALDPTTLDYLANNQDTTTNHVLNFIDGLYETDQYGNYTPALATEHTVSEDGLTYTYTLRKGVQWVDVDGNDYAEVKAEDFVTGLKHAVEEKSMGLPVVENSIKNLRAYADGKIKDFSEVGIKAVDDYTLQYTLEKPEPYFNSKTTFNVLYPVNKEFLESKGKDFGSLSPDSILYNGPFRLTNLTAKSSIEYVKNDKYWDKDNVFIETVNMTYNDGSDLESFFRMFKDGAVQSFAVFPNLPIYEEVKKTYPNEITVNMGGTSTYYGQFNFGRGTYENTSKTSDAQKQATKKAILNKHFRQALLFGFDRVTYVAQQAGDEYAAGRVRNTLVPGHFVTVGDKQYGEVLQDKLQKLDSEMFGDVNLADGQDGYYNVDKAKKALELAKKELGDVEYPIHLDVPCDETDEIMVNWVKSMKKSIEDSLGTDNVVIDVQILSKDKYWNATFNATTPEATDYDISTASGWIPDFQDPSTFLNILNPENGELLVSLGLKSGQDQDKDIKEAAGLYDYDKYYQKAVSETKDLATRFGYFADAEAQVLDNVLIIPLIMNGAMPRVTKFVPFSGPYSLAGNTTARYKFVKLQDQPVTKDQYEAAKKAWQEKQKETQIAATESEAAAQKGENNDKAADSEKSSEESK